MKHGLKISLILILGIFILLPALRTLVVSFDTDHGVSFANYEYLLTTPGSLIAIKNSILLGLLTVLICGGIGTFLAFFVHFFDVPFNRFLDKVLMLPLVVPGLIIVFSFMQLYGESGLVTKTLESIFRLDAPLYRFGGLSGILLVHAYTQYIYFYMNVTVAIKQLDRSVMEASMNLGASPWKIFSTIIYPFIKPALISSSILTFMTGIGSFSAPNIIGGGFKVLTTQILLSKANMYLELAAAQVVVLSFFAMSYLSLARKYERKASFASAVRGSVLQPVKVKSRLLKVLMMMIATIFVVMIFLPIVTIGVLSFVKPGTWMLEIYPREFNLENYVNIFTKSRSLAPFVNSVKMAMVASLLGVMVSVPVAYILTKTSSRTRPLIEFMVMLPFAMPASAIAINMINGFSQTLLGTWVLLPLAYFVSLLPLAVRSVSLSYQRLKNEYAEASKNLGAGNLMTFRKITLPLIAPGIWAGLLFVFIRSLGEYTISAFLYTASNRPLSIAMVNSIFEFDIGLAMAYGTLVLVMTFVGAAFIKKFQSLTE